jgi:RNA 3'-terminal phosphate cyclase-like protein
MAEVVANQDVSKLKFEGAALFRMRIISAILKGQTIQIEKIRQHDESPGLRDFEVSFLRLMDSLTNGSTVKINHTGTSLFYRPGILIGGSDKVHQCPPSRSIGYFLEPLIALAPFCKIPISIRLHGVTHSSKDISIDIIRVVLLPLLTKFGVEGKIQLKVEKRGPAPLGGGQVYFSCPIVRQLTPVTMIEEGKVKRIRGLCHTSKCAPQLSSRVIESARAVFNNLLPDVHIYTQHFKGKQAGGSPGYAVSLVAETTSGVFYSSEAGTEAAPSVEDAKLPISSTSITHGPSLVGAALASSALKQNPQDIGTQAANVLLEEVAKGGCVDTATQSIVCLLMVLCPEDVSKLRVGKLSPHTVGCLRLYVLNT